MEQKGNRRVADDCNTTDDLQYVRVPSGRCARLRSQVHLGTNPDPQVHVCGNVHVFRYDRQERPMLDLQTPACTVPSWEEESCYVEQLGDP